MQCELVINPSWLQYQQRCLGLAHLLGESRGTGVSFSWFSNLPLLADDPKFYSVMLNSSLEQWVIFEIWFQEETFPQLKDTGKIFTQFRH